MKVLLVGCGNMGMALLQGWLAHCQDVEKVYVLNPSERSFDDDRAIWVSELSQIDQGWQPDLVILAVKPWMIADVLPPLKIFENGQTAFVSVAAGILPRHLRAVLEKETPAVTAMPNIAAKISQSMTVGCSADPLPSALERKIKTLFQANGEIIFFDNEDDIDVLTPVAGSGPAYFYWLTECMADYCRDKGIPAAQAEKIARQTYLGSALLAADRVGESMSEIRESVTSKGGTTAAALDVFMGEGSKVARKALEHSHKRAKELGENK